MADVGSALTLASAGVAAGALVGSLAAYREGRAQEATLKRIAMQEAKERVQQMDVKSAGAYLFDTLGAMSIRDYARDPEARQFVARAIDRVGDGRNRDSAR
jgi:hypothetical protein